MIELRDAAPGDRDALVEICRRTEFPMDAPRDPARDPELLGEVYAAPYAVADPGLATVAVDARGEVVGYLVATADTRAFEAWMDAVWLPPLRARHPLGSGAAGDAWLVEHIHRPGAAPAEVVDRFPAHLHIDLLDAAQGQGIGRRLMALAFERLAARGAPGVHLGVVAGNAAAIAFYERLGFGTALLDGATRWMTRPLP